MAIHIAERTRVVFRVDRSDGQILAVFPGLPHDDTGRFLTCYAHVGQHGGASPHYVRAYTRPATPEEYAPLRRELEAAPYGYVLDVRARMTRARRG